MKLDLAYKKYMSWLTVNEGKSPNTIDNYGRDLRGYLAWLQQEEITDTDAISGQLIEQYLQSQKDVKAVRSIAREAAAIRSFHHYLAFVYDAKDPSVNIEVRHSEDDLPVYATRDTEIRVNDRIGQFRIIEHQPKIVFEEVETLGNRDRGGFGSTGRA